ncbi:leukocyte immunoglobulin-like receptor subfamily B member 3 [Eublepharis macularius]|uniref:Leukocyte immunoglobulin-like receptor subfamily B member 3 n=1 Tax=Eublepharis macularius TaxID=481883 RepID=A0AA97K705_EUBMA|nr:leukocyte immunoglobulin-like receptor subfamily B member 3 [Eublepharis macularius]
MRFSSCILFLGWWVTGRSSMTSGAYPRPSISVEPSENLTLGAHATIYCKNKHHDKVQFKLHKEPGSAKYPLAAQEKSQAEFFIQNVSPSDAGIYWCQYCLSDQCSDFSDKVAIYVTDPSLSKPFIRAEPKGQIDLGLNVTIECQGPEDGLNFSLHQSRNLTASRKREPGGDTKELLLSMVTLEDAGSYTCQYHLAGNPFVWSEPSNPVDLILRDPNLPQPSIKGKPSRHLAPGSKVTIHCQGPQNGLNFSLHKSGNLTASQKAKPDKNTTKFILHDITSENAGTYTCQYVHSNHSFIWSRPSQPVELVVTAGSSKVIWASSAGGLSILLLLLVAFLFYRKRRTGFSSRERHEPVNVPMQSHTGADQEEVTYVTLDQRLLKAMQSADPARVPEPCVYEAVAKNRIKAGPEAK